MKYSRYLILAIVTISFVLSSCSQKNYSSAVHMEMINDIAVPPEPDPRKNDATLAGVDINNNGVRDDIEITIAQMYGGTKKYKDAFESVKRAQTVLTSYTGTYDLFQIYACNMFHNGYNNDQMMTRLIFNTQDRREVWKKSNVQTDYMITGAPQDSDIPCKNYGIPTQR